jgi:hypothetical protein
MKSVKLPINLKDDEAQKLLPTVLVREYHEIHLPGINSAISAAIRSTLLGEMKLKALTCGKIDTSSTLAATMSHMIADRIDNIPLKQTAEVGSSFKLNVANNTGRLMTITSAHIEPNRKQFNETFELFKILPGTYLHIGDITVTEGVGHQHAKYTHAHQVASIPTDVIPRNNYEHTGVSSSVADPHDYKLSFYTNGTISGKELLRRAIDEITARLNNVITTIDDSPDLILKQMTGYYNLQLVSETFSIGNLFMKAYCTRFPNLPACTVNDNRLNGIVDIRIKNGDEDIIVVVRECCLYNIKLLSGIKF